jgi:hypothetical protein
MTSAKFIAMYGGQRIILTREKNAQGANLVWTYKLAIEKVGHDMLGGESWSPAGVPKQLKIAIHNDNIVSVNVVGEDEGAWPLLVGAHMSEIRVALIEFRSDDKQREAGGIAAAESVITGGPYR